MQVETERIEAHLQRQLSPVYLIWGDEALQSGESRDAIRAAARGRGFDERITMIAARDFDWQELASHADSLSLFSSKRMLDVRITGAGPGDAGSRALLNYLQQPQADLVLVISAEKLDWRAKKSRWYQRIDELGTVIHVRPPTADRFPAWIRARMRKNGLVPGEDAVMLLAERAEGNLLAAAQEIEKLRLELGASNQVTAQDVLTSGVNSARFDMFQLVDAALAGDSARVTRILSNLRQDGTEPLVVLWALVREIRVLEQMAFARQQGRPVEQVLRDQRVWSSRKALVRGALEHLTLLKLRELLVHAAHLDFVAKGTRTGNIWHELLQLSLGIAGEKRFYEFFSNRNMA